MKTVICVEEGTVISVYSDNPKLEIVIVDYDVLSDIEGKTTAESTAIGLQQTEGLHALL